MKHSDKLDPMDKALASASEAREILELLRVQLASGVDAVPEHILKSIDHAISLTGGLAGLLRSYGGRLPSRGAGG